MSCIDDLPIPDWGLRCPQCDAVLAGMPEHQCGRCGHLIDIRYLLSARRPIPELGLDCERCGYSLTGLMEERCPECGLHFSLRAMLEDISSGGAVYASDVVDPDDHHLARRPPQYTGRERPLPDFGLACSECGELLAGAEGDACAACGAGFDLDQTVPAGGDWVNIGRFVPAHLTPMIKSLLYAAEVPYVIDNARMNQLYGGVIPFLPRRLRVPRVFFFDALHAIARAEAPPPEYVQHPWQCPGCGEDVPAGFEVCWNCSRSHPESGSED